MTTSLAAAFDLYPYRRNVRSGRGFKFNAIEPLPRWLLSAGFGEFGGGFSSV
jgi:hypothetical protein